MNSFNPDQLMLIVFLCAIPALIIFLKKSKKMFSELAQQYNGTLHCPYLGIALGIEIPFKENPIIFDPYGLARAQRRNEREKKSSLIWEMSNVFGPKAITIKRSHSGLKISQLAFAKHVKTNDSVFDQEFEVICRDETVALEFLSSELRELLLAKGEMINELEIENGKLILRHRETLRNMEQFRHFIDEGVDLMKRITDRLSS